MLLLLWKWREESCEEACKDSKESKKEVTNVCLVINMAAIEVGRICVKTKGRDSGEKVVVTKVLDDSFVMVRSPARKKGDRKCAVLHLEPTDTKVSV
jgi:hypothetical protein